MHIRWDVPKSIIGAVETSIEATWHVMSLIILGVVDVNTSSSGVLSNALILLIAVCAQNLAHEDHVELCVQTVVVGFAHEIL
jgi:hypothetical protein